VQDVHHKLALLIIETSARTTGKLPLIVDKI